MKILIVFLTSIIFIVGCSTNENTERKVSSTPVQYQNDFIVSGNEIAEFRKYSEAPWGEDKFANNFTAPPQRKKLIDYTIKKGDTLMLISGQLYGDYRRWKEIHALNPISVKKLRIGSIIKVFKPESPEILKKGLPYIIKKGDTLGTISKDKYGTFRLWRTIYEHNKKIIKNPNQIYAGFTIYYVPKPEKSQVL